MCYISVTACFGQDQPDFLRNNDDDSDNNRYARVPRNYNKVRNFLKENCRKYDPENAEDKKSDECIICLDSFESKIEIVGLNCTGKHIFHLKCMEEWVKHNNICPLCREPIIKKREVAEVQ